MDLLPEGNAAYGTQAYWDQRYEKEDADASFDWFKSFAEIADYIHQFVPDRSSRILILGCGNSTLSKDLFDDGYKKVVSLDYSPVVIEKMKEAHRSRPELEWVVGDIRALPFPEASFDVAIDKGTMDALLTAVRTDVWNPSAEEIQACREEVDEVGRVLTPSGVFLYLTFGQPHFRRQHLIRPGWELTTLELGDQFHYYLYVSRRQLDANPIVVPAAVSKGPATS